MDASDLVLEQIRLFGAFDARPPTKSETSKKKVGFVGCIKTRRGYTYNKGNTA